MLLKLVSSGGFFPSANTPIEQVANNMLGRNQNNPNIDLGCQGPINLSGSPAYQVRYGLNQQGDDRLLVDYNMAISGGSLYIVKYAVPE